MGEQHGPSGHAEWGLGREGVEEEGGSWKKVKEEKLEARKQNRRHKDIEPHGSQARPGVQGRI